MIAQLRRLACGRRDAQMIRLTISGWCGNIYAASHVSTHVAELLSNSRGESRGSERCRLQIALAAWESLSAPAASSGAILAVEIQPRSRRLTQWMAGLS
jgi:hypothetical protein